MTLTNDDRSALLLAADLCARYGRAGLADRLRSVARSPQEPAKPPPPEPEEPRRHVSGRPPDDVSAIAMAVRQLGDDDVYSLFRAADRIQPNDLTALIWRQAQELQQRRR